MIIFKCVDPPIPSTAAQPIWEYGIAWPDIADIKASIWIGQEGSHSVARGEWSVAISSVSYNAFSVTGNMTYASLALSGSGM